MNATLYQIPDSLDCVSASGSCWKHASGITGGSLIQPNAETLWSRFRSDGLTVNLGARERSIRVSHRTTHQPRAELRRSTAWSSAGPSFDRLGTRKYVGQAPIHRAPSMMVRPLDRCTLLLGCGRRRLLAGVGAAAAIAAAARWHPDVGRPVTLRRSLERGSSSCGRCRSRALSTITASVVLGGAAEIRIGDARLVARRRSRPTCRRPAARPRGAGRRAGWPGSRPWAGVLARASAGSRCRPPRRGAGCPAAIARSTAGSRGAGGHGDDEPAVGLALVALQEAVDVDVLVGAQALRARRHLHVERLDARVEADRVAQLGIAEPDRQRSSSRPRLRSCRRPSAAGRTARQQHQ